jgi:hypothetical protein
MILGSDHKYYVWGLFNKQFFNQQIDILDKRLYIGALIL